MSRYTRQVRRWKALERAWAAYLRDQSMLMPRNVVEVLDAQGQVIDTGVLSDRAPDGSSLVYVHRLETRREAVAARHPSAQGGEPLESRCLFLFPPGPVPERELGLVPKTARTLGRALGRRRPRPRTKPS